jgi:hypothetical protein
LLERLYPKRVFDLELRKFAICPIRLDEVFAVFAVEARSYAVIIKTRIVEVGEHRLLGRVRHRKLVLRATPQIRFRLMALSASLAADEYRRRGPGLAKQALAIHASEGGRQTGQNDCRSDSCSKEQYAAFRSGTRTSLWHQLASATRFFAPRLTGSIARQWLLI